MAKILAIAVGATLWAGLASAQHAAPYAGLETRPIKALSAQQVEDLRAGRGMGLALAAELNGYPGPLHAIELAEKLRLSDEQRARMAGLFGAMKAETIPIGERLIAQEAGLDAAFAGRTITPATLAAMTDEIGRTQGALRAAHLKYHLATLEVLSPEQVAQYGRLRGYGAGLHGKSHRANPH